MNEPFLLSNLIELQELDNEIFKLPCQFDASLGDDRSSGRSQCG